VEPDPGNAGGGRSLDKINSRTRILVETTVFAALSAVLYTVRPFTLPFGGSVTLGSMVPVMWLSLRRGVRVGVASAMIFGILALFIDIIFLGGSSVVATPIQAVLEYPLAFGVLGLAGMFHKKTGLSAAAGVTIAIIIRFLIHYFVGALIWVSVYQFPPEWGQFLWPAIYNGSFLLVEYIISIILIEALVKAKTLEYNLS
jgi:thiamine transporter